MTNFMVMTALVNFKDFLYLRIGATAATRARRTIEYETEILCRLAVLNMCDGVDHEGHEGGNDHFPRVDWTPQIEKFLSTL
jgi:hypothetical protein